MINISKAFGRMIDEFVKSDKGIIIAGPMEYDRDLIKGIKKLSAQLKYPVFADGLSQLRFNARKKDKNIISNYNSILKSEIFILEHDPEIILQFRRTPTSSMLESFLEETNANRYVINSYGDKFDPTKTAKAVIPIEPKTLQKFIFKPQREGY